MKFGSVSGTPKTMLRLDDSLERSTVSEKTVKLTFLVYYSKKRYQLRSAKGKGLKGKFRLKSDTSFPYLLSAGWHVCI